MKLDCEIVKDLLPLYSDNVCSEQSRAAVEEHLKECEPCREELKAIGDTKPAELFNIEKGTFFIGKYRQSLFYKIVFFLVCAIALPFANGIFALTMGESLQTAFVTFISILAFVYIPAVVRKKRFVWITVSTVLAPVIFMWDLGVFDRILNYSEYREAYGDNALLGLMFLLIPSFVYILLSVIMFLVNRKKEPLDPFSYRSTALKIITIETFCLYFCGYITILSSMGNNGNSNLVSGTLNMTVPVIFLWIAFLIFRFCKKNIFIRLGAYSIIFGVLMSGWTVRWNGGYYSTWLLVLIIALIVSAIFFAVGIVWEKGEGKKI